MLFWQESLQRNPANQSLTHLWLAPKLSKLQLRPAAVCYLGQCPTVSPERMAFEHGKKGHYKGFKGEALAGERGLLAPAPHSPPSWPGLAPWTGHGRRKRCWPEAPFMWVNKQTPHGKGLLCLSHGEPSVPQPSTGGKGHGFSPWGWRGEGRRGQEAWWQTLLQHSWHQQRWERSCLRREVSTLQQHGESITSQSLAFTWKWRRLASRDTETTQSTLINTTPGPNELLRWWYTGFWHLTGSKKYFFSSLQAFSRNTEQ